MEDHSVQFLSREIVKPSSQVQNDHPEILKLSYLDQLLFPMYIPIVLFYQANEFTSTSNHLQISQNLKLALSNTLATFYPLAGRMNDDDETIIDCNDSGVEFVEARVHARLENALKRLDEDDQYLTRYLSKHVVNYVPTADLIDKVFLLMQITFFDCGGIALGICCSHMLADGHSLMMFLNAWASACRRTEEIPQMPCFDLASHFPARAIKTRLNLGQLNMDITNTISKMLVFNKEKIAILKKKGISPAVKDPTRVEVITAFIWKFMIETKTVFSIWVAVNLRGRKMSMSENMFGNCVMVSYACDEGADVEFGALVNKLRRSIRRIDEDYITESQNGDNYVNDACGDEVESCSVVSWSRFAFYELDLGFGTPVLFCPIKSRIINNNTILVSTKSGEDIQAWVTMDQQSLEMLKNQINLISTTPTHV